MAKRPHLFQPRLLIYRCRLKTPPRKSLNYLVSAMPRSGRWWKILSAAPPDWPWTVSRNLSNNGNPHRGLRPRPNFSGRRRPSRSTSPLKILVRSPLLGLKRPSKPRRVLTVGGGAVVARNQPNRSNSASRLSKRAGQPNHRLVSAATAKKWSSDYANNLPHKAVPATFLDSGRILINRTFCELGIHCDIEHITTAVGV